MKNVYQILEEALKACPKFLDESGNLNKGSVMTAAIQLDAELLSLIKNNELLRDRFFKEIDGVLVFDRT